MTDVLFTLMWVTLAIGGLWLLDKLSGADAGRASSPLPSRECAPPARVARSRRSFGYLVAHGQAARWDDRLVEHVKDRLH